MMKKNQTQLVAPDPPERCRRCGEYPGDYARGFCSHRCEMDSADGVEPETTLAKHWQNSEGDFRP